MSGIKGLVILTRYDYIETTFGKDALKTFFKNIDLEDKSQIQQPVIISNDYPEIILKAVDTTLLRDYLHDDIQTFHEIGRWNARHMLPRYFQLYIDQKRPASFLAQFSRTRDILIGLGDMTVVEMDATTHLIRISYGQPYIESVRLSEMGFIEEGCKICGAKNVRIEQENLTDTTVEYQINWD